MPQKREAQTTVLAIGRAPLAAWKASGRIFRSIMGFAVFLTAWEVLASVGLINAVLLPSPTTLFWAAGDLLRSGTLFRHVGASIERVLVGFALASLVGLTLGVVLGWFRMLSAALGITVSVRTSPKRIRIHGVPAVLPCVNLLLETCACSRPRSCKGVLGRHP